MRKIHIRDKIKFPLYRFTKKKWVNCFFNTGQLRLGTLFDYAQNESYGDAVHDRHEGYCAFRLPHLGPTGRPVVRLTLARNNLVLCLSEVYEKSMYDEFDENCCIRIEDVRFFQCIDNILKEKFTELLLRRVTYIDKSRWDCIPDYEDFAGVMKDQKFKYQCEIRALWEPNEPHENNVVLPELGSVESDSELLLSVAEEIWFKKYARKECQTLEPKTILVPEAIQYCSIVNGA